MHSSLDSVLEECSRIRHLSSFHDQHQECGLPPHLVSTELRQALEPLIQCKFCAADEIDFCF